MLVILQFFWAIMYGYIVGQQIKWKGRRELIIEKIYCYIALKYNKSMQIARLRPIFVNV